MKTPGRLFVGIAIASCALGCGTSRENPETGSRKETAALAHGATPLVIGLANSAPGGGMFLYDPAAASSFPSSISSDFTAGDALGATTIDDTGRIVIAHGTSASGVLFEDQTGKSLDPTTLGFAGTIPYSRNGVILLADVTGDTAADVVSATFDFTSHSSQVFVTVANNNERVVSSSVTGQLGFPEGGALVVCDFDGDKVDDIIVAPSFEMYSGKTGTLSQVPGAVFFDPGFDKLACGDLNDDGFDDLVIGHTSPNSPSTGLPGLGSFEVISAPGQQSAANFFSSVSASLGKDDEIASGDLDGDGFAEFIVGHHAAGTGGSVTIFSAAGQTRPKSPLVSNFPQGSKVIVPTHTAGPVTTHGLMPFHVESIFYDPAGGATQQQYGKNYSVSTSTTWQTVEKNGAKISLQVGKDGAGNVSGDTQISWENIVGGGTSETRTETTVLTISGHSDLPSALYDLFYVELAIPITIVDFPDGRPEEVTLDDHGTQVVLSAQQLLAIANSSPDTDDLLQSIPVVNPDSIAIVKAQLAPESARNMLLLDPNFFIASDGSIAQRNADQLNQLVQSNPNRFQPGLVMVQDITVPGTVRPNTLQIPAANPPNNQAPTRNTTQQLMNATSLSDSSGFGDDEQDDITATISFPIYGKVAGQLGEGYVYEEEYQRITTKTTSPGTQDQVTPQMASPCIQGLVDVYYDLTFGTYLYVSHDIQFVARTKATEPWFSKLCGGKLGSPSGVACNADADCTSLVCANGVCARPACSANVENGCATGEACGLGGPFGDCQSQLCNLGICSAAFFAMSCSADSDCITGSCVDGACGTPSCAPQCEQGAGCGADSDCKSQICAAGLCMPESNACSSITRLKATGLNMCATLANGQVDCWGNGSENFGANGASLLLPTPEPTLSGALDWDNSFFHSCAVLADGRVRCWGRNNNGALGDGTNTDSPDGTFASGISNATKVVVSAYSTCALLADDSVSCWGNNTWGQLGDGTTVSRNAPMPVVDLGPVVDLTANAIGYFAVLADHSVKYWGSVYNGAYAPNAAVPVDVPGFNGATQISLGMNHACAVMQDGTVECVGDNSYGQLGDGSIAPSVIPVTVAGLPKARKVVANYWYSCALLVDGTAQCWGFPGHSVLGTGTALPSINPSPLAVQGITNATDIVRGMTFDVCVLNNGCSVSCWGSAGGLGIGSSTDQALPPGPSTALIALP